ncbi:MAG: hypothetical protein ACI4N3_04465 [Alphaproteobacteria bacterium]
MKNNLKISLIALSTLLTACGGGGSGNSVPNTTLPTVSKEVENYNRQVTSLKNHIDLTKAKPETVRSATSSKSNIGYADIGNIKFKVCSEDECGKSNFELDKDGKIIAWGEYKIDQSKISPNGSVILSTGDTKEGSHYKNNETTLTSIGKEVGLSYFDFFKFRDTMFEFAGYDKDGNRINADTPKTTQYGLYGGYKEREISSKKIDKDIEEINFTGKAVGGVDARLTHTEKTTGKIDRIEKTLDLEGNATLNFKNGDIPTSTLTMNFDNWYDVIIKQKGDISDKNYSVEFINFKENADKELQFDKLKYENGDINDYSFAYYYDDTTDKVVEAGGGIEVIDRKIVYPESHKGNEDFSDFKDNLQEGEHAIDFNAAFGLKRD